MLTRSDVLAMSPILGDRLLCDRFGSFPAADSAAGLKAALGLDDPLNLQGGRPGV